MTGTYQEVEWRKKGDAESPVEDNRWGDVLELSDAQWRDAMGRLAGTFGIEEEHLPLGRLKGWLVI